MKLSTNLINLYSVLGLKRAIDMLSENGFSAIDFNADTEEFYTDAHDIALYKEIKAYANDKGMTISQAHAPFPVVFEDKEKSRERFDHIVKSMYNCAALGAESIVVHPTRLIDHRTEDSRPIAMELHLEFYNSLIPYAKDAGIKIALENIPRSVTESAEGITELLEGLNDDTFTVCFDVGHANIACSDPAEEIRKLRSRITFTHIHDNDGVKDQHLLPYFGTVNWDDVMKAFGEIGYKGNISYEAGIFLKNTPLELYPKSLKYMSDVGHYLIEGIKKSDWRL